MSTPNKEADKLIAEMPNYGTNSAYVRWLVHAVYFLLCEARKR